MPNLQAININRNQIKHILNGTFAPVPHLITLSLAMNLIVSDISTGMWQGLQKLEKLDLGCNQISFIPYRAFSNLINCKDITLYNNSITHFSPGALAGLFELDTFDVRYNSIHVLSPVIFDTDLHTKLHEKQMTIAIEHRSGNPCGMFCVKWKVKYIILQSYSHLELTTQISAARRPPIII